MSTSSIRLDQELVEKAAIMAKAFSRAVKAGREAYLAGFAPSIETANASSPLTGFLRK